MSHFLTMLVAFGGLCAHAQDKTNLVPTALVSVSKENIFSKYYLLADKSQKKLFLFENKDQKPVLLSEFPSDMGKNAGDKTKANDHKTPVGIYFLQKSITQPEIPFELYGNLAFTTDYPNIFDKRDGKTGYGIWLHAVPDEVPLTRGSRGCVVVRNDVIKELKNYIQLEQTPLLILDQVELAEQKEHEAQRKKFLQHFENWRLAWESQSIDEYMSYYDSTYRNDDMNYKQWFRHKKKLKELYSYIKVQIDPPLVLRNKDMVVIRFIQRYESNLHKDYGEKTIHARYDESRGFKIIREDWKPLMEEKTIAN